MYYFLKQFQQNKNTFLFFVLKEISFKNKQSLKNNLKTIKATIRLAERLHWFKTFKKNHQTWLHIF